MKRGLVIGKFYPPHRGHKLLIDTATAQVDHLVVIVCARADQSIPGSLRVDHGNRQVLVSSVSLVPNSKPILTSSHPTKIKPSEEKCWTLET